MAFQLGNAYGKVTVDARGVKSGVGEASTSLLRLTEIGKKVGQGLTQTGQALTVGLTLPIIAAGTAAIKFASDLSETKSKVKQIFGDMSEDLFKWSETANTRLGLTRQAALDGASTFALFGKAAKLSGEDLTDFAKQNVQFAADFASFYNTNPEEAIMAIGAAYRGESEPIRKYNILLNDQIIKQKAAALGILDTTGQLSMQNRILAVNALIMEQSSAAQGDFARTSGGLANQTKILQAQLQDVAATFGERLLPMAIKVVGGLNSMLDVLQKLPAPVQDGIMVFLVLLAVLGPVLIVLGQLITAVSTIAAAWPTIVAALPIVSAGLTAIGTAITGTLIPAITAILVALGPIILTIGLIAAAFGLLYLAWTTDFLGFQTTLKQLAFIIQFYFKQGMEGAKKAVIDAGPVINKNWNSMIEKMKPAWDGFIKMLGDTWKFLWDLEIKILSMAIMAIVNYVLRLRDQVLAIFRIDWGMIGRNIIAGIISGIVNGVGALVAAVKNAAMAALNAAKEVLGIHSESTAFKYLGKMSGLGYMNEIGRTIDPSKVAGMMAKTAQPPSGAGHGGVMNQVNHFADGLTIRDVERKLDERDQRLYDRFMGVVGAQ